MKFLTPRTATAGLTVAVAVAAMWAVNRQSSVQKSRTRDRSTDLGYSGVIKQRTHSATGKRVVVCGDDLTVGAYLDVEGLTLSFREVVPGQGASTAVTADYFFATSFPIIDVCGRQSSEIFVLGADNVVERWTQEMPMGSRYLTLKSTQVGPNVPVPDVESGIKGGTWLPLSQRPKELRQRRSVVLSRFSGADFGVIHVDPEGRYLLLVARSSHDVYQLSLTPGSQPVQIANSATISALPECGGGHLAHHETLGRLFVMERTLSGNNMERIMLVDSANDGAFESTVIISNSDWLAQGMDGPVWYRPNFFDYSTN